MSFEESLGKCKTAFGKPAGYMLQENVQEWKNIVNKLDKVKAEWISNTI
jgi:hypothetical protein